MLQVGFCALIPLRRRHNSLGGRPGECACHLQERRRRRRSYRYSKRRKAMCTMSERFSRQSVWPCCDLHCPLRPHFHHFIYSYVHCISSEPPSAVGLLRTALVQHRPSTGSTSPPERYGTLSPWQRRQSCIGQPMNVMVNKFTKILSRQIC